MLLYSSMEIAALAGVPVAEMVSDGKVSALPPEHADREITKERAQKGKLLFSKNHSFMIRVAQGHTTQAGR